MLPHHESWLAAHPERSAEWLRARIADGFDIHHLDGDHSNNAASNLVLIESSDHMMLHGGRALRRIGAVSRRGPSKRYQRAMAQYMAVKAQLSA